MGANVAAVPGPLSGLGVIEQGGIGPVPHAGMILADLGADVVEVDGVESAASQVIWSAMVVARWSVPSWAAANSNHAP